MDFIPVLILTDDFSFAGNDEIKHLP